MARRHACIFGGGGHARVVASLIRAATVTFVVPNPTRADHLAESAFFERIEDYASQDVYIGIGDNDIRRGIFDRLASLGITPASCVAPTAFIAASASLGRGVVVCPGGVVMANAEVGANVIVNTLSSVDHDCVVGDHSQITAGVTLGGTVTLGRGCFLGIKSAVLPNLTLGDAVVVMAGSLVTGAVPGHVMVGGSPARIVRTL